MRRFPRVVLLAGMAVASLLVGAPLAQAWVEGKTINIAERYDTDGNPFVTAYDTQSGVDFGWKKCFPDLAACTAIPDHGWHIDPGDTQAGTRFQVQPKSGASPEVVTSHVWNGRLHATSPSAILGSAQAGSVVAATPAIWSGGWGFDRDLMIVIACKRPALTKCEPVLPRRPIVGGRTWNLRVGSYFVGWSLYAINHRESADEEEFAEALRSQATDRYENESGPTSFSPAFGPILETPGLGAKVPRQLHVANKRVSLARISCPTTCKVIAHVEARDTQRSRSKRRDTYTRIKTTVSVSKWLRIPARKLPKRSRVRIIIHIDGGLAADTSRSIIRR